MPALFEKANVVPCHAMGDGCSETSAARPHSKWHDMVMTEVGSTQSNTQGYHREGAQGPTAQREVAGGGWVQWGETGEP